MDGDRFDILARSLGDAHSRRSVLAALLASTVGLLGLADTAGKTGGGKKKKKGKRKNGNNNDNRTAPPPPETPSPACADGVKNGSESDVDCGGGTCLRCANGKTCASRNDCVGALCTGGACQSCVNAADCGVDADGSMCACRDTVAGPRICTKQNCRPLIGGTCAGCVAGEQCAPAGADVECCLPCGG